MGGQKEEPVWDVPSKSDVSAEYPGTRVRGRWTYGALKREVRAGVRTAGTIRKHLGKGVT